jgi:alpha-tubulin suppressor-like RCC1 family protein
MCLYNKRMNNFYIILPILVFISLIILFYISRKNEHFEDNTMSQYIIDIATGANHSVFLNEEGKIYACGKNDNGRLGIGTNVSVKLPFSLDNSVNIQNIYTGNVNTFFITKEGIVYGTGENTKGQLGIGNRVSQFSPTILQFFKSQNIKISKIAGGWFHTLFLSSNNDVYMCGGDDMIDVPIKINLKCKDIGAGKGHSVFLSIENKVYTMGWNWFGQLGNGATENSKEPVLIDIKDSITKVYAGMNYTILLNNNGKVYGCGDNTNGQLGLSSVIKEQRIFTLMNVSNISSVSAGQNHTLFKTIDGNVYATGMNIKGQLGIGHNNTIFMPQKIQFFNGNIEKISAGANHSIFLTKEGITFGCGDNTMGGQIAMDNINEINIPDLCDIPIERKELKTYQEEITGIEPERETAVSDFKPSTVTPVQMENAFKLWIDTITSQARSIQITNPSFTIHPLNGVKGYAGSVVLPDGRVVLIPLWNVRIAIYDPSTNGISYCSNYISGGYFGGVLLKDGRVFLANHHPDKPAIYDPKTNRMSSNSIGNGGKHFRGCVLLNDGRVLCIPQKNNVIGLYDPNITPNTFIKLTYNGNTNNTKWSGGVVLTDGRVVLVPRNSNTIGIYDPKKSIPFTLIETPLLSNGGEKYETGCLLPDGRVIFTPLNANNIGIFNPVSKTFKVETFNELPSGGGKYHGCVTLPDGRVLMVPWNARNVGIYTPSLNGGKGSFNRYFMNSIPKTFVGASLMPNGKVLMVPYNANNIWFINGFPPVSNERCIHAVFNKY